MSQIFVRTFLIEIRNYGSRDLKPSLRHSRVPEDPHVIGRESD